MEEINRSEMKNAVQNYSHVSCSALCAAPLVRLRRQRCCSLSGGDGSDPPSGSPCLVSVAGTELVLRHSHTLSNKGHEKRVADVCGAGSPCVPLWSPLTTCHPTLFHKVAEA